MTNKPMLSVELLRCPFCGGKNLRQYSYNPGMDVYYRVQCYCLGSAQGRTPDEAVEEWNKRYPRGQGEPVAVFSIDESGYRARVILDPAKPFPPDGTLLYAEQPEPEIEYPPCDYCGTVPSYHPWHGAGLINGKESPHIHACTECRNKLPAPLVVVMPERMKVEPFTTIDRGSKSYKAGYNAAISEVAKLNGLKP